MNSILKFQTLQGFYSYPVKHGGSSQVGKESLLEQSEEQLLSLDAINSLQEEYHALLVPRNQP